MSANYSVPTPIASSIFDDVWDDPRVSIPRKTKFIFNQQSNFIATFTKPNSKDNTSAPSASISIAQRNTTSSTPNFGSSGSGTIVSYPQLNPNSSEYLNEDDFDDEWGSDDDEEIAVSFYYFKISRYRIIFKIKKFLLIYKYYKFFLLLFFLLKNAFAFYFSNIFS